MQIKHKLILGFLIIFAIFAVQQVYQSSLNESAMVSLDYVFHVGQPADEALKNISLNFESLNSSIFEHFIKNDQTSLVLYEHSKKQILTNLERCDELRLVKNNDGDYFIPVDNQKSWSTQCEKIKIKIDEFLLLGDDVLYSKSETINNVSSEMFDKLEELDVLRLEIDQLLFIAQENSSSDFNSSYENMQNVQSKIQNSILFSYFLAGTSVLAVVVSFSISIQRQIFSLKKTINEISEGVFSSQISSVSNDEFHDVIGDVNNMAVKLEKLITTQKQKERMSSIGQFAAHMSHDLRNPISVIAASLENLKLLYGVDKSQIKSIEKIERSLDRIVHQVDEVLDFVREHPVKITKEMTSKIIAESVDSIKIPDNIKLILPENDVEIFCDKILFSISLNNLILNSIQAIDGVGTIEITVEKNDDSVIFQIIDSGAGISQDNLDKIFEPLFTTKQQGTGLGLASVKSIIESHGGKISAKNNKDQGVTFTIKLPIRSDDSN